MAPPTCLQHVSGRPLLSLHMLLNMHGYDRIGLSRFLLLVESSTGLLLYSDLAVRFLHTDCKLVTVS